MQSKTYRLQYNAEKIAPFTNSYFIHLPRGIKKAKIIEFISLNAKQPTRIQPEQYVIYLSCMAA
jgi:hypothetical protein